MVHRRDFCPACGLVATGEGERCIFCGTTLLAETVTAWRPVYHAYSYADAMLATSALRSHGLTAEFNAPGADRALMGWSHGVVRVAEGEHLRAQEVLRQLRGVRTDTEYREWQQIKSGRQARHRLLLAAVAALALLGAAALAAAAVHSLAEDRRAPRGD